MEGAFRDALSKFKVLNCSLEELEAKFPDILTVERQQNKFSVRFKLSQPIKDCDLIVVTSNDIRVALSKRLRNQVTNKNLEEWASFLILFDAYEITSEEGETVRAIVIEILHKIAAPESHNELTDAIVRYYLNCLDSKQEPEL